MSTHKLAYARVAYKSFSRSARHIILLIATHQNIETGWAFLSYLCLSEESGLTRRRVMQLVALLEAGGVLEVRRGHGRGHVNFYRILREEDGLPVPYRGAKKVKSKGGETVKFPTPPEPEKVKSETGNNVKSLTNLPDKVVETKEREKKEAPAAPVSLSSQENADASEKVEVTPEQLLQFGLTPGSRFWRQALGEEDPRPPV